MYAVWIILFSIAFFPNLAKSQVELSVYSGTQAIADSRVSGQDPGGVGDFNFNAKWSTPSAFGNSNYGLRVTWWQNINFGWGLDLNQTRFRASNATLADNGLNALDFSDGLRLVTVNAYRRWKEPDRAIVPYVGAGLGLAIPSITFDSGAGPITGQHRAGPAIQWLAGASYPVSENVSVFGEYRGSYSRNGTNLQSGGTLDTNIYSSALNIGVSLGF